MMATRDIPREGRPIRLSLVSRMRNAFARGRAACARASFLRLPAAQDNKTKSGGAICVQRRVGHEMTARTRGSTCGRVTGRVARQRRSGLTRNRPTGGNAECTAE